MHICSINNHIDYSNKIQHCQLGTQNLTNINFQHHPDFVELAKDYNITASNYFRRGCFWGGVSKEFVDVINSLKLFFNPSMNLCDKKINMLIGGIAESQEPYSIFSGFNSKCIWSGKTEIANISKLYLFMALVKAFRNISILSIKI